MDEPLREWIKTAHHAEKLALSEDFYEIKIFAEKIGTNRRMLDRKILFGLRPPFDLIPKYKGFGERSAAPAARSEPSFSSKNSESIVWSGRAESNRGYMHPMHAYYHYTTARNSFSKKTLPKTDQELAFYQWVPHPIKMLGLFSLQVKASAPIWQRKRIFPLVSRSRAAAREHKKPIKSNLTQNLRRF